MGLSASLSPAELVAEPGTSATFALDISGAGGPDAHDLRFDVGGTAGEWATVLPPRLSLPAGGRAQARVVVSVPRSPRTRPGPAPLAVRVVAGGASVEAQGVVDVRPFADLRASVSPRVVRARLGGEHTLRVDNLGNVAVQANLVPHATDDDLLVEIDPPAVPVAPGDEVSVQVRLRARRRRLFGRPRAFPFNVAVRTDVGDAAAATADGVLLQERQRWPLPSAAALVLVALATGVALGRGGEDATPRVVAGAVPSIAAEGGAPASTCPPEPIDASGNLPVENFLFCPPTVTVAVGGELRWVNRDAAPHTVSADGDAFDTGSFGQGDVRSVRFDKPATYTYFCRLHPFMRGTIVVTA